MQKLFFKTIIFLVIISSFLLLLNQLNLKSADKTVAYKTHALLNKAEEINTIFFGSSSTRHSFDPQIFDSLMAAGGIQTKSFNYGLSSMGVVALQYHMENLLRQGLPNLKHIIFELSYPEPYLNSNIIHTWRMIEAHDFKRFRSYCEIFWQQFGGRSKFTSISKRLYLFIRNISLAGRGERVIEALSPYQVELVHQKPPFRPENPDGFRPLDIETDELILSRRISVNPEENKKFARYMKRLRAPARTSRTRKEDYYILKVYSEIIAKCKLHGIQPIILAPPKPFAYTSMIQSYQKYEIDAPLLIMNKPDQYPQLYDINNWYDSTHLNWKGARLATKALVELMLDLPEISTPKRTDSPLNINPVNN